MLQSRRITWSPCKVSGARKLIALMVLATTLQGCSDDVVEPSAPGDPVRTDLVTTVRQLAREQSLRPVTLAAPVRDELSALGRALAFDKILSGNRDVACMTCHLPTFATGDGKSLPVGQGGTGLGPDRTHPDGQFTLRHSLALFNLHRVRKLFWDGRLEELDDGSIGSPAEEHLTSEMEAVLEFGAVSAAGLFPVSSREEMLGPNNELAEVPDGNFTELWSRIMNRLGTIDEYRQLFEAAYPGTSFDDMTFAHASNAIGGFFASSFSFSDSPWDRFLRGDDNQLTEAQLRGARNFMTVGCTKCHQTDVLDARPGNEFHNDALAQFGPGQGDGPTGTDDFGRERATGDPEDRRRFKTPPLRNIELTAPYGHVGQFVTLRGFVEHYNNVDSTLVAYDVSQVESLLRPTLLHNYSEILATRDTMLMPIRLEEAEVDDLIEFLKALTDDAARDLSAVTPASVPSGLPIDRAR
ncbi:cytochrome-c peroxidase [Candidatus Palauibacter sp.]|uniref:cytochrome-c peroxidase n=1 Tax=Candidatus Palauibacter sp. TaxID=3101350 RepID=UPI003B02585E